MDSLAGNDTADARWLLAERVGRALPGVEPEDIAGSQERVVRLAVPAGRINAFRWLREQRLFPKSYWSGRGERTGVAAVGIADVREMGVSDGAGSLSRLLASLPDAGGSEARYYGGTRFDAGQMIVLEPGDRELRADGACRLVLIGGEPLDEPRFIEWNFVSSSRERIEEAKSAWRERRFPAVPGDDNEFIPLPE